ncbi:MAG TPA: hypothetical protein VHG08_14825, partial [Longimicrobium sp.]|nr:hypothetical protein [Longimicrobium sp.]
MTSRTWTGGQHSRTHALTHSRTFLVAMAALALSAGEAGAQAFPAEKAAQARAAVAECSTA